jgi:hypothetical protein
VKARLRFGHLDLLIAPSVGNGERWVEQHRVVLDDNVIRNVIGVIGSKHNDSIPKIPASVTFVDHA